MVKISPCKILLISLCFFNISSFELQRQGEIEPTAVFAQSSSHPSLDFQNRTGPYVTPDQFASFINFINSASSFFQNDTKARLDYISEQMNKTYGRNENGYSVLQEGSSFYGDWAITTFTNFYACTSAGVDKMFPKKSYMFLLEPDFAGRVFFSKIGQKGSGINASLEANINEIILTVETGNVCKCQALSTRAIADQIDWSKRQDWNVFCSQEDLYLNVYTRNDRYIYTKPKNCHYGIYETK